MTLPFFDGHLSKKDWENLSDEELDALAVVIFNYYREKGFPYYSLSEGEREKEFFKLKNYFSANSHKLIDGDKINMSMHGLALAWSYFPHAWDVKVGKMKTPFEVFYDDEIFLKAIRKRFKRGTYFSDSGIRKALRTHSGAQGVSNFRPTAAASIYHRYLDGDSNRVWDMSGGFGGRMLGASVSGKVYHYIATDPSYETYRGLIDLSVDISSWTSGIHFNVYDVGSEVYKPSHGYFDLCFTSPPYFDTERYSEDAGQSYIAYPSVERWNVEFLEATIINCYFGLKSDGLMILNVADVRSHPTLQYDTICIAKKCGFEYVETLRLSLSNVSKGGYKYEPVYVFRKVG